MNYAAQLALVACLSSCALACSAAREPVPVEGTWEQALELSRAGDEDGALSALQRALASDPDACQRALLEPEFERSDLRDSPEFRDALHEAAVTHRLSRLTLAPSDEPGEWIEVDGRLVDTADKPVPGGIVRLCATDAEGRYHPEIEGDRVPRLFATLVADEGGRFGFRTVRPGPYPGTRNARHVHITARAGNLRLAVPGYVVFDDDPLLDEPQNAEQRGEAVRIKMSVVDGVARGELTLPLR